jgi:hypothetical protein
VLRSCRLVTLEVGASVDVSVKSALASAAQLGIEDFSRVSILAFIALSQLLISSSFFNSCCSSCVVSLVASAVTLVVSDIAF